jgi:hypothetical protein
VLAAHGPNIDAVESYKDFLLACGFLAASFSVADSIDAGPLSAISLDRVA